MISERDVIYVTKKQASLSVAFLIILGLLIFMLGYFWGKQSVLEGFGQKATQESIQDQNDYLATMQSFAQKTNNDPDVQNLTLPEQVQDNPKEVDSANTLEQQEELKPAEQPVVKKLKSKKYHAVLIGFGTKAKALAFVNRLKKHNVSVELRSRVSKSASGTAKRTWYQIVTKSYDSKEDVQHIINKVKKFERIKDSDIKIF